MQGSCRWEWRIEFS